MFSQLFNIRGYIKTLHEAPIEQIALAVVMGMFVGLLPVSINSFIIALFLFVLRTNKTAGFLSAALFGFLSVFLDPIAHGLGYFVLVKLTFLRPAFVALYNIPIMPLTGFNNTIVMGNTVLGVLLSVPVYKAITRVVLAYRSSAAAAHVQTTIIENKNVGLFTTVTNWFDKLKGYIWRG